MGRAVGAVGIFASDPGAGGLDLFSKRVIRSRLAATSACSASISATMACCLATVIVDPAVIVDLFLSVIV